MSRVKRKQGQKRRGFKKTIGLLLVVAGAGITAVLLWGNPLHEKPQWQSDKPIFIQGKVTDYSAEGTGEDLMLPLSFIEEYVDDAVRYEAKTQSVIMATREQVLYLSENKENGELNGEAYAGEKTLAEINNEVYVPYESIEHIYGTEVQEDTKTGAVMLMRAGESVTHGKVKLDDRGSSVALRSRPSNYSPIVKDMAEGETVRLWGQENGWYYIQLDNGYTGYIQPANVILNGTLKVKAQAENLSASEKEWKGRAVNLAWEAVYSRNPDTSSMGTLPGVNVVSPTWFSIVSEEGTIEDKADPGYVQWAHGRGMEVWGLLSNSFDPDLTSGALSTYERRMQIIRKIITLSKQYNLDGINIDFENVYTEDGANVTQFMRELKPLARANDLILSIDVTPKSDSEMWSVFLDRASLGGITDYMMVMAYDEHWASSPEAGSVASLPWTESSVKRIMDEDGVPPEKLVLGIPLYTRVWSEEEKNGEMKVSSKAIGMESAADILKERKLKPKFLEQEKQNYVEYEVNGVLNKIWLEDGASLKARVKLAQSLQLGGIGVWNRSFASDEAWDVLKTFK
ncbi:glycosyl hydrolase family 18 protein [Paenibacillus sp. P96]|uniref:Glycosyl hydrolase family 18 protein n=1 Tax=Paenibacillus zeirhizosphaerae TaxID=2987519 RepID=A0ABT9FTR5_9BACL|nr:glycosyl hydrolase family 18 protein [Paenibacillus sp. P96]MDP4098101.1 glycosyl hydrolase family 18 protein [Paenibacillus sp. P96]